MTIDGQRKNDASAEIERAVATALYDAFDEGIELKQRHLEEVPSDTVPLSRTARESIDALRSWVDTRAGFASGKT